MSYLDHGGAAALSLAAGFLVIFFLLRCCCRGSCGCRNQKLFHIPRREVTIITRTGERKGKGGPPEYMKKRASSWAHCFMTFHLDLSLDEATDSVGIPVFLSVGLLGPVVAFRRACAAPRGSCPSVHRTSIWPTEATSATKHLTFSRSIVEANLIGTGEINFSARRRRRNRNGLSVRS